MFDDKYVPEFPPLVVSSQRDVDRCDCCGSLVLRGEGRWCLYGTSTQLLCRGCENRDDVKKLGGR